MLHGMLKYSEVATDLVCTDIATTPLELRPTVRVIIRNKSNNGANIPNDGAEIGNECNNARISIGLDGYRQFTPNQLLVLSEEERQKVKVFDKISEFSIRPPELLLCFDKVGLYYRWFKINEKT